MSPTRRRERPARTAGGARAVKGAAALCVLAFAATACNTDNPRLGLPTPVTEQGKRVLTLWQGSWLAALLVGALVWGLIIWAVLFHRKRSDELPPQVRYNLPIEMLYTVVPFVIIAVLFYFTARDETYLDKTSNNPQVRVTVTAFQWSWQFDYPDLRTRPIVGSPVEPNDTADTTDTTGIEGARGTGTGKPVLYLPVGRTVRFHLQSRDVVHSFWVPSFIFKRDIIPGAKTGTDFQVTPTRTGTYEGRCAELCGVFHSRMLFQVKIVTPQQFDQFIRSQGGSPQL